MPVNEDATTLPSVTPDIDPEEADEELDEAYKHLQNTYPQLDWKVISEIVSRALEMGFHIGADYEYRHPD